MTSERWIEFGQIRHQNVLKVLGKSLIKKIQNPHQTTSQNVEGSHIVPPPDIGVGVRLAITLQGLVIVIFSVPHVRANG